MSEINYFRGTPYVKAERLSDANAKIAALEKVIELGDSILGKLLREKDELAAKVEKLTGYLAHEATLNLELEAKCEALKVQARRYRELRESKDCMCSIQNEAGDIDRCARCWDLEDIDAALSLTPSSALLAHDLELAERAMKECHTLIHLPSFRFSAFENMWLASQTRRSIVN